MLSITPSFPNYIKWIGDYHPYWIEEVRNPKFDSFSDKILRLKEGKAHALQFFYEKVHPVLGSNLILTCVPSSDPANLNTGIRALTKKLVNGTRADGNECLVRAVKLPKKANGGMRKFGLEKMSLEVKNHELIKGQTIVLLDDVTTTGTSLRAGRELFLESGATEVICWALGRTNWD